MNFQQLGHVIVDTKKIKILYRVCHKKDSGYVSIKLRKSGKDGDYLDSESIFLSDSPEHLERLEAGETLKL